MCNARVLTNGFESDPALPAGSPYDLFGRLWTDYSFPAFAAVWQREGLMKAACWSCANFSWFEPIASRSVSHGIRPFFASHRAFAPVVKCIGAPSPVSSASQVLKRVFEVP